MRRSRERQVGGGCASQGCYLEEGYAHQDPGHHNQVVLQPFLKLAHTAFGVDGALLLKLLRRQDQAQPACLSSDPPFLLHPAEPIPAPVSSPTMSAPWNFATGPLHRRLLLWVLAWLSALKRLSLTQTLPINLLSSQLSCLKTVRLICLQFHVFLLLLPECRIDALALDQPELRS